MNYKIYLTILFLLVSNISFSQDEWKEIYVTYNDYNLSINEFILVDKDLGFLLGDDEQNKCKLFKTTDLGNSFTEIIFHSKYWLNKIIFQGNVLILSNSSSYEIGNLFSIDSGKSWFKNDELNYYSLEMYFVNEKNIFKYKYIDSITTEFLYSSNFGIKWELRYNFNFDLGGSFHGIYFLNPNIGFLLSKEKYKDMTYRNELYKTTNGGYNWQRIETDVEFKYISRMKFKDSINGTIYCHNYLEDSNRVTIYNTNDCGNSWTELIFKPNYTFPYSHNYFHSDFIFPNIEWILSANPNSEFICKTVDFGRNFIFQDIDLTHNDSYKEIVSLNTDTCFIITRNKLIRTFCGGNKNQNEYIINKSQADSLFQIKQYNEASDIYLNIINQKDNDGFIYYNLGYSLLSLNKYELSLIYLKKAEKYDYPDNYSNNVSLAIVYDKLNDIENAIYYYEKAMESFYAYEPDGPELIDTIKDNYERLKNTYKMLIENANKGKLLYLELVYDTQGDVFNVDFKKVYKIKEYCEKCLEYKSSSLESNFNFKGIIAQMNKLIKHRDDNPELYRK
jgi:hypothetical protein